MKNSQWSTENLLLAGTIVGVLCIFLMLFSSVSYCNWIHEWHETERMKIQAEYIMQKKRDAQLPGEGTPNG